MQERKLSVRANPHAALDHKGRPAAVTPYLGTLDSYIGAVIDFEQSKKEGKRIFAFSGEPVDLTNLSHGAFIHYLSLLQRGELLPADEATAKLAGVKLHGDAATAASMANAIADHKGRYGVAPAGHEAWGKPAAAASVPPPADGKKGSV